MPTAAAVFLNYNGLRHLRYCLPAFKKAAAGKVTAIVVDSGSTDGSQEFLAKEWPQVKLLQLPHNMGWAGGNNAGILYAIAKGFDYVFVLNTDIVIHKGFFDEVMKVGGSRKDYGIFGCKIYFMGTRRMQAAGGGMLTKENPTGARHFGQDEQDRGQCDKVRELDYLYEPAFAVKREVFEKVGLLDPDWFILMEGADFCLRARRAGFKTVYVPKAVVEHEVSGTTDKGKNKKMDWKFFVQIRLAGARNGLRFMLKHHSFGEAARYQAKAFEDALRKILAHPQLLPLQVYGVVWNLVHLPQTLSLRGAKREDYESRYEEVLK